MFKNKSIIQYNLIDINLTIINSKCSISCYLESILITSGIFFNIIFLIFAIIKKKTGLNRRKPMSNLLIAMTICDTWNSMCDLNIFFNTLIDVPDIGSYTKICQLSSFLSNYFTFLNVCIIFTANSILISIIKINI